MAVSAPSEAGLAAPPAPKVVPRLALVIAVFGLFGAEAIHMAVIHEHIDEWLPFGLFFIALSITEALLAVALITKPSRWVIRLVIGVGLGTAVLWLYTRAVGGSHRPDGRARRRARPAGYCLQRP